MRIKFNKFERVAGIFVGIAIIGTIASGVVIAVKRGWFERRVTFETRFDEVNGIHPGTLVQMSGLRAGSVDDVELQPDNTILVRFSILSKFHRRVRQDSTVQLVRPFIIGEKVMDIQVGSNEQPIVAEGGIVSSAPTLDVMDLISGRNLGEYLQSMTGILDNVKIIAEAFQDQNRTKSVIETFDRIGPLVTNLNKMSLEVSRLSRQLTHKGRLPKVMEQFPRLTTNLADLSEEFRSLVPAIREISPDLPYASMRALEALDQAVILLKAMQKSFFVSGSVKEVREEEKKEGKRALPSRRPASKNRK